MRTRSLSGAAKIGGEALGEEAKSRNAEAWRQCRVLIVDDDELVRARLAALLRTSHFDVDSAASGQDAMRIMAATDCQIVLTDWQMPDMDGLTLCRNVRSREADRYVYVVMHTVRDGNDDLLSGLAAGADDYIVKGAPVAELLARLEVARRVSGRQISQGARQEKWLASLSDPLTSTNNLRYLVKHLPRELARARRYEHALAMVCFDIDGFKQINDHFGQKAADELLREAARRVERCVRKDSDWLARTGADEFMLVLPETRVHGAHCVAQKIRESFAANPVESCAGPIAFTVSIGIAAVEPRYDRRQAPQLDDILRAADRGLMTSKRRGGNRVTAAAAASRITIEVGEPIGSQNALH